MIDPATSTGDSTWMDSIVGNSQVFSRTAVPQGVAANASYHGIPRYSGYQLTRNISAARESDKCILLMCSPRRLV
jgi:hypothetical protein